MTFAHLNVRSMLSDFNNLKDIIVQNDYDFFGLTETWLVPDFDTALIDIDGYYFNHLAREGRGGGVGFYLKKGISYSIIHGKIDDFIEHLWLEFTIKHKKIIVGIIYRPGSNIPAFLQEFEDLVASFLPSADVFLCLGDFNIDALNCQNSLYGRFTDILDLFNLKQIINEPTRITAASATLIDFVVCDADLPIVGSGVCEVHGLSDHSLVYCLLELGAVRSQPVTFTYRNINNVNIELFNEHLRSIPWEVIFDIEDINEKMEFLNTNILQLFDFHAPVITRSASKPRALWMTDSIELMQRTRDKARKKYKRTGEIRDWNYYVDLRNYIRTAVRKERRAYLEFACSTKSSSEIWSDLRKADVYSKTKTDQLPVTLSEPDEINAYFSSVHNDNPPHVELLNFYNNNVKESVISNIYF